MLGAREILRQTYAMASPIRKLAPAGGQGSVPDAIINNP